MVSDKQLNSIWWIFLIILFMIIPFVIITSLNWKVEAVAENPNSRNLFSCTLAAKMDTGVTSCHKTGHRVKPTHCQFLMKAAVVLTIIKWLYWLNKWVFSKSIYRVKCRIYLFKFKSIIKNLAQKLESLTVKTSSLRYQ